MMRAMDTTGHGHDWKRLGQRLRAARALRGLEQQAVAATLGKGRSTIRNIEIGQISTISPTLRRYAALVEWPEGAIERVLAGGEPDEPTPAPATPAGPSDLSARLQQAITDGVLIDGQVLTVPLEGGEEVTATIVVRGHRAPTPDELRSWERQMQAIEEAVQSSPGSEGDS